MILLSLGTLIFSTVNFIKNNNLFFIICLILRFIQSIGKTMVYNTTYTIISKNFLYHMSTILGCVEAGAGFGYTIGPTIGGFLYQYLGFIYLFLILGCISSVIGMFSYYYINFDDKKFEETITNDNFYETYNKKKLWKRIFKIKDIWCLVYTVFFLGITSSFQDSSITIGCKQFNFDSTKVGLMLMIFGGAYTLFSPISGIIVDKYPIINFLIIFGYILQTIVFFLMRPVSLLNYNPNEILYVVCLLVMGFSVSIMYVPSFKKAIIILKNEKKFPYNFEASSIVSGMVCSSYSFGSFLGPIIGSIFIDRYHYNDTLLIFSKISLISMILFFVFFLLPRIYRTIITNSE